MMESNAANSIKAKDLEDKHCSHEKLVIIDRSDLGIHSHGRFSGHK